MWRSAVMGGLCAQAFALDNLMEKAPRTIAITVAGALITSAILHVFTGFTYAGAWQWFCGVLGAAWRLCIASVGVPAWLLVILGILSLAFIVVVISEVWDVYRKPSPNDYKRDAFDGLVWRWGYTSTGRIKDPWCFCPSCDAVLVYTEKDVSRLGEIGSVWVTELHCDHCNCMVARFDGGHEATVDRIRRLIDRKIRVGEWQEVVAPSSKES